MQDYGAFDVLLAKGLQRRDHPAHQKRHHLHGERPGTTPKTGGDRMTKKEKTRPLAGRAGAEIQRYFTTRSGPISRLLLRGQENAIPLHDLKAVTGWDGRTIRRMIERERRSGVPILADNSRGYFLPANYHERAACVCSMRHRALEILRTAQAIEAARMEDMEK